MKVNILNLSDGERVIFSADDHPTDSLFSISIEKIATLGRAHNVAKFFSEIGCNTTGNSGQWPISKKEDGFVVEVSFPTSLKKQ